MATVAPTKHTSPDGSVVTWVWEGLTDTDDGAPVKLPEYADKTVQVLGDFENSAVVDVEGSCGGISEGTLAAPTTDAEYGILSDPGGTALEVGAAAVNGILENPLYVRPHITSGGDEGTDLDVFLVCRRPTDLRT